MQGQRPNIINTLHLSPEFLEDRNLHLQHKYKLIQEREAKAETFMVEDADLVVAAFGLMSHIAKRAVMDDQAEGH